MKDLLPSEVLNQPKAGFAAPVDYWLANDLKEMTDDLLSTSRIRKRGLFRPEGVQTFIDEHRSGAQDWSMQIWQFLTLEVWMQTFLDVQANESRTDDLSAFGAASALLPYEFASA
jgi:asparagine synthase (glutamine-hydrolysing)